jgi:hypothetical protein
MVNEQAVVVFDDQRAVANAGVMLPALLARRLGIEQLVDQTVRLGVRRPTRPRRFTARSACHRRP